jgi:cell division protein FtsQ
VSTPTVTEPPVTPTAPPLDPRIRARRIAVRRDEGRRRRRRLVRLLALGGVVLAGWLLTRSPALDVDRVTIVGAEHTPPEALLDAAATAGARRGGAMTDVDPSAAADAVERLPWIAAADVERRWPSTLRIAVTERVAVASVPSDAGWWLVDGEGRLLELLPAAPAELVALEGVVPPEAPGALLASADREPLRVATALPASLHGRVVAVVRLDDDETLHLRLAEGAVVHLGDATNLSEKMLALVTLLEQTDAACAATIDVRVPVAPVLTHQPGCA